MIRNEMDGLIIEDCHAFCCRANWLHSQIPPPPASTHKYTERRKIKRERGKGWEPLSLWQPTKGGGRQEDPIKTTARKVGTSSNLFPIRRSFSTGKNPQPVKSSTSFGKDVFSHFKTLFRDSNYTFQQKFIHSWQKISFCFCKLCD